MEVVLVKDVPGLGKRGAVVSVKTGYARNYLLPRGFAVPATKGVLKQQQTLQTAKKDKDERAFAEAEENAALLGGKTLVFERKVGQGRIFGSITAQEIAAKIWSVHKIKVDRRKILIGEHLKSIGRHEVTIVMHPKVRAKILVEIKPEVAK